MLQNKDGVSVYTGDFDKIDSAIEYQKNDILVSNIRPYLQKIWLADVSGCCSPDIIVFRIDDTDKYLPLFIYYALRRDSFFEYMMETKTGLKMPRGNRKQIMHYLLPEVPMEKQVMFSDFAHQYESLNRTMQEEIEHLQKEKTNTISQYFG